MICKKEGCENEVSNQKMVYCSEDCAPYGYLKGDKRIYKFKVIDARMRFAGGGKGVMDQTVKPNVEGWKKPAPYRRECPKCRKDVRPPMQRWKKGVMLGYVLKCDYCPTKSGMPRRYMFVSKMWLK